MRKLDLDPSIFKIGAMAALLTAAVLYGHIYPYVTVREAATAMLHHGLAKTLTGERLRTL